MMKTRLSGLLRPWAISVVLLLCVSVPLEFIPNAGAATSSSAARLIKKLKKEIKSLKAQLAEALRPVTPPAPLIEMVTVGNRGNLPDPEDGDRGTAGIQNFGAVPYDFQIGKYEVTISEYAAFLNAVAATDTYALFNPNMATDPNSRGIQRSGSSGSFSYQVIEPGNRPITYVSWFDAARFCNWLHHGRPTGLQGAETTETGAYVLQGATSGLGFPRQWGAKYWIPSEDEWYKAAYHQPSTQDGDDDDFWLYPTRSNSLPGNVVGELANQANFRTPNSFYSVTQSGTYSSSQNYLTTGEAFSESASFYGTFDQGGNVYEWNDAEIGPNRGRRGGSWGLNEDNLRSSYHDSSNSDLEYNDLGFRVASHGNASL